MKIDLTPILQALIGLLAALITAKLIPWIKSRTSEKQLQNIRTAARIAVMAAEQIYGHGVGEAKLQYATEALEKLGYSVDFDLVREAIEDAVRQMNSEGQVITGEVEEMEPVKEIEEHAPPDGEE